jgi:hypothetical protein
MHIDEKIHLVRRSIINANKEGKLTTEDLPVFIGQASKRLSAQPERDYRCWAKISIGGATKRQHYRYDMQGGRIYVRLKLPEALQIEEYFISAIGSIYPDRPVGGSYLVANGSFRSDTQAGSSLAFLMEDFSGILTYSKIRFRRVFRSGRLRPKSQAMLGGSYYLFADDQHFIKDRIWYDADFREDFWQDCRYSFTDLGKADGFIRNLIRSFDKSTSSKVLWSSFRVASRAWMSHDPNDRLAQLLSAFEILFSRSDRKTIHTTRLSNGHRFSQEIGGLSD